MSILPHLQEFFTQSIDAYAIIQDEYGSKVRTFAGDILNIPCRVASMAPTSRAVIFKSPDGKETVSKIKVTCAATHDLQIENFVFRLPAGYSQRHDVEAIGISKPTDENGIHHIVIYFA